VEGNIVGFMKTGNHFWQANYKMLGTCALTLTISCVSMDVTRIIQRPLSAIATC
jgi:hypothetical protein